MLRIGVDVGGTFTDFAAWRDDPASLTTYKVSSTPPNFIDGFKAGFEEIVTRLVPRPGETVVVMHGTTVSTNTVIERNGSVLALLVTRGFRDILDLQRFRLNDPIRIDAGRTEPLVPRHLVFEVDERLEPDGSVHAPIAIEQVRQAVLAAKAEGATSIAIAFLHSYANPDHERAAAAAVAEVAPEFDVSISSEILPRIGEYERSIACVLNAYVRKRLGTYVGQVEAYLAERLAGTRLFITRSNGGALAAQEARSFPIHTLLSGPASGVTAARFFAAAEPERRFLTMDMGGTSTDMSLILDGRPTVTNEAKVGDFPLTMTVTGIEAVGAGGGSIAWLDGTVLRVGPRSAGAWPGPACFGRGGTQPTVTDAYLLCGYIDPDNFLGGRMKLDIVAARHAFEPLAAKLGIPVEDAAEACITVASSNMVAKALPYFARHGVDQEELTLVLFGGAGSLHGPLLAHELGINRLLVPRTPSVFCAFGGLVSELVQDMVATVYGSDFDGPALARRFGELEQGAQTWLAAQAGKSDLVATRTEHWAEMRYLGQFFSLNVLLPAEAVAKGDLTAIHEAYHAEHERLYSHADREAQIEILELRVRIAGALPMPAMDAIALASQEPGQSQTARSLRFDGTLYEGAPVHDRDTLGVGTRVIGPAIIEQSDTTIFVIPGFVAETQASGDLLMTRAN
ncbi:hydantoinase/oxoprolinase family protein [Bosea sp. BK604]|uniref:hydantoinase/oxoprolinase family protein n=1 Tax=Bosea sp. BK604 TaxID=2512180 RepID=UPI001046699B|nr:hydantoinase/oxoprolinase family protein [Bosea sp. BK604]TCR65308.1 N-methylhydantoinase A [Bosea sp. BK604]